MWSNGVISAVVLVGLAAGFMLIPRLRGARRASGVCETSRDTRRQIREQQALRQDMEQLLTRIEKAAAAAAQQIDGKMSELRELILACDAARTSTNVAAEPQPDVASPPSTRRTVGATGDTRDRSASKSSHTDHRPQPRTADERRVRQNGSVSPLIRTPREPAGCADDDERDDLHDRVLALADSGRRPMDVAEALDLPLGEVELILQLRALS